MFNLYKINDHKQACDLANKSDYGLSASVFTQNEDMMNFFATRLVVGSVWLNEMSGHHSDVPSGGTKDSGFGRDSYFD